VTQEQIGKYRIAQVIGKGAMGVVYRAFDPQIEREVALKTIRKELLDDEHRDEIVARFKNEARAAGRLSHPSIVAIYDYGEDAASAYIVMELVDGVSLGTQLREGLPIGVDRVRALMSQILHGLDYAHSKGVTHRDVKPGNILITAADAVKLTDFGIARIEQSNLTASGSVLGTPNYMSPEQLRGEPVDGRSDIFSAGIVLYQMLTGVRPFRGAPAEVMQKIVSAQAAPPSSIVPALGTAVDEVLARALARDRDQRFGTATQFLAALGAAIDDDATRVARPLPVPPNTASPAGGADETVDWKGLLSKPIAAKLSECTDLIGPMATVVVRRALAQAIDPTAFCAALDVHIPAAAAREAIRRAVDETLIVATGGTMRATTVMLRPGAAAASTAPAAPPAAMDAAALNRALAALTEYVGPVAKLVVGKAARSARDPADFIRLLGEAIPKDADRAAFLKKMQG
jgi:serine/threonine-protein kinase